MSINIETVQLLSNGLKVCGVVSNSYETHYLNNWVTVHYLKKALSLSLACDYISTLPTNCITIRMNGNMLSTTFPQLECMTIFKVPFKTKKFPYIFQQKIHPNLSMYSTIRLIYNWRPCGLVSNPQEKQF